MGMMRGFARILAFGGRDTRGQFWPYAGLVVMLAALGGALAVLPAMESTMTRMQQFAQAHPDQAEISQGPTGIAIRAQGYHPELMPDFGAVMTVMGIVVALAILLLAAAVARRLRDAGAAPLLGLLPVPFLLFGIVAMRGLATGHHAPEFRLVLLLFANNLLYLASLAVLVVLLCRPSRAARPSMR